MYYRFGGRAVAWRNNSGLRYVLADHLSSSQAEVGGNQAEMGQRRFYPFGSDREIPWAGDLSTDERFTSQRRIDAGGGNARYELYYYGARWYLPGVGIFTQPDSIVPDYRNPQALNRYSYGYNNPVKYTDPTGFWSEDELNQHLGEDWKAKFFGENGLFGNRPEFEKFLTSTKSADLSTLRLIATSFQRAGDLAQVSGGATLVRTADALMLEGSLDPELDAGLGASGGFVGAFVANLQSGEASYFFGPKGGVGVGVGFGLGSASFGLIWNAPDNRNIGGANWGVSGQAAFIAGPTGAISHNFPSDVSGRLQPAALQGGAQVGLLASLSANFSATAEVWRHTAQGSVVFPGAAEAGWALNGFLWNISRALLAARLH